MEYIQVPNWESFQHYSKRNPPWIKLYTKLLDNPGWHALSGDAKGLLIGIWILAGQTNNRVQLQPDWLAPRTGCPRRRLDKALDELERNNFVSLLASSASVKRLHKSESESEEKSSLAKLAPHPTRPADRVWMDRFDEFWKPYPRKVGKQDARKAFRAVGRLAVNGTTHDDLLENMLTLLELRVGGLWAKRDVDTIPYPGTFIRAEDFTNNAMREELGL